MFSCLQCDRRFDGNMKYPLPNAKAAASKIGKGGNGSVFVLYHEKKQYAVKQVHSYCYTYNYT